MTRVAIALAVLLTGAFLTPPAANAADVISIDRKADSVWDVDWIFEYRQPDTVECGWGTGDPSSKSFETCSIKINIKYDQVLNKTGGFKPSSKFKTHEFKVLSRQGVDLTGGYTEYQYVFLDGPGLEKEVTVSFKYSGPTEITFQFYDRFGLNYKAASGSRVSSYTRVTGVTKDVAITNYNTAAAAAAAKAAADRAAADAKAKADAAIKAAEEKAAMAAKLLTITCKSGSKTKVVKGENPVCPKGYTNPLAKYLTFQAYAKCKLFKKNSFIGNAELLDGGKTLTLNAVGKYSYLYYALTYSDMSCALNVLKAPSFVTTQIDKTRALDGMQRGTWGKVSAFWTYHPDNGANISFTTS